MSRNKIKLDVMDTAINHWLKDRGLDSIRFSISEPFNRDTTQLTMSTMVYATKEISGLQQAQMSKDQLVGYIMESLKGMIREMAEVCEDISVNLLEGVDD